MSNSLFGGSSLQDKNIKEINTKKEIFLKKNKYAFFIMNFIIKSLQKFIQKSGGKVGETTNLLLYDKNIRLKAYKHWWALQDLNL